MVRYSQSVSQPVSRGVMGKIYTPLVGELEGLSLLDSPMLCHVTEDVGVTTKESVE